MKVGVVVDWVVVGGGFLCECLVFGFLLVLGMVGCDYLKDFIVGFLCFRRLN